MKIVPGKKIGKGELAVFCLVFLVMFKHKGDFQQLFDFSCRYQVNGKKKYCQAFFHSAVKLAQIMMPGNDHRNINKMVAAKCRLLFSRIIVFW